MKLLEPIHPATRAALVRLATVAPKHPVKGRGHRRVDWPFTQRGEAKRVWDVIPTAHKVEIAERGCGGYFTTARFISPEAAAKLKLNRPLAAVYKRAYWVVIDPANVNLLGKRFGTERGASLAAQEACQERRITGVFRILCIYI